MNDLATLNGVPRVLRAGGKAYPIHPLTLAELGGLQAWVDAQFPDPYEAAARACRSGNFTQQQQQYILKCAGELASRRRLIGTAEADEVLRSMAGIVQVIVASVRKGDPAFGEAEARALAESLTPPDVERLLSETGVDAVTGGGESEAGPKAAAPGAAGPTTPATTPAGPTTSSSA